MIKELIKWHRCLSCADNFRQAVKSAREALHLHIAGMIIDDEQIPKATDIENVLHTEGDLVALIEIQL